MMGMYVMIMLMLSGGGGNDLLDYISTSIYWEIKGVKVEESVMLKELDIPKTVDVSPLVKQLGAKSSKERDKAYRELSAAGAGAVPALTEAAKSDDIEVASSAREILKTLRAKQGKAFEIRRLMAIRTLGEMKSRNALNLLKTLAESQDFFTADYAKASIALIEGREYIRPGVAKELLATDLACMPAGTGVAGQITRFTGQPVDLVVKAGQMAQLMGEMGGGDDVGKMIPDFIRGAFPYLERIGNIRIQAATFAVAGDIGNDSGSISLLIRGVYDRVAVRELSAGHGASSTVGGLEFISMDGIALFCPASRDRFLIVIGPSEAAMPLAALAAAVTAKAPKLQLGKKLQTLIGTIDTTSSIWLVAEMTDGLKKFLGFQVLDSGTMTATETRTGTDFKISISADKEDGIAQTARIIEDGLAEIKHEMLNNNAQKADMAKVLKPFIDFIDTVKCVRNGRTSLVTGHYNGAVTSSIMMLPLFFIGSMTTMHRGVPMPIMPQPEGLSQ